MTRTLSQKDAEWLQGRGISETTTIRFGISTVQHGEIGSAIAIPFMKDGKTINHKPGHR